jgi:hypothetical protein
LEGEVTGPANATIIANNAVTTPKIADNAVTNAKIGEIVSVAKGGSGANMSSTIGYVKQATAGATFTTVAKIPVADVDGAVRKVNGIVPDANGNVATMLGRVFTGATVDPNLATSIINASPAKTQSDIYIVADGSNPNNGRTFIYDGTTWLEVATNLSTTDARYVNVAGDTMEGNLTVPTGKTIILTDAPANPTEAANKAYVDATVAAAVTATTNTLTATNGELISTVNGVATTPAVNVLTGADNGLTPTNGNVKLGGSLTAATTITTDATKTLAIAGLQDGANTDKIVVANAAGVLKSIDRSTLEGDLRLVGVNNHITQDAGTDGTSVGTGEGNIALGKDAMKKSSAASFNVAIGQNSLEQSDNGFMNTAIGFNTLNKLTAGNFNVAIGGAAEQFEKGSHNVFLGTNAGANLIEGDGNIFIGNIAFSGATNLSNKLKIHNKQLEAALIDGDFATRVLTINNTLKVNDLKSGATATTGNRPVVADANGQLMIGTSAVINAIAKKTADYTVVDADYTILADATSGAFTLTLPVANTASNGRVLIIRKTDETANVLTFSSAIKISETTTFTTLNMNTTIRIQSDGTAWYKID